MSFVLALLAAPAVLSAQGGAGGSIVVTAPSVRVRSAPAMGSLTIEEFRQGWVFSLAPDEYQSKDWMGVAIDGRILYVPRFAVAPRARAAQAAQAVQAAPAPEARAVVQAGVPTPAAPVAVRPTPAPAPVAVRPAVAPPAPQPAAAAVVVQRNASPAMTPVPERVADRAPRAPERVVAAAAAPAPMPAATVPAANPPTATSTAATAPVAAASTPAPASERPAEQPAMRVRLPSGFGVTVGAFGSVTPIKTAGIPTAAHIAGLSFIGVRYRMLGLYGAPEFGQGGGYRSTMMGGGASLDLLRLPMLHLTALGGLATYSETTSPADTTVAPVTSTLKGTSVGGMASIPLFGPLRLGYRGQYFMVKAAGVSTHMIRHYVGLVF